MKLYYIGIYAILTVFLSSCCTKYFKKDLIKTTFTVTDLREGKYSVIEGYIVYNNIKIFINNGNDGYYYKNYNLSIGQSFKTNVFVYYYHTYYGYELKFGDVDFSKYEKVKFL